LEKWPVPMRILAQKLWANVADFCPSPNYLPIQLSMIHMDQMIPWGDASIIIFWTYQDMMEWMSRILVGEMAGANEDFCSV
jgi:hypothetical protein